MKTRIIVRLAAILAPLGLLLALAVPAHASTWSALCDTQSTILCAYSDGTDGNLWYGKLFSRGAQAEATQLTAIISPCGNNVSKVQDGSDGDDNCNGASYWWPSGTHAYDLYWGSGNVGEIQNTFSAYCMLGQSTSVNIKQGDCTDNGNEWVSIATGGTGNYLYNVFATDSTTTYQVLCANGQDNPLIRDYVNATSGCAATIAHIEWAITV